VTSFRKCVEASLLAIALLVSWQSAAHAHEPAAPGTETVNFDTYVKGAAELEGKIIAPCCWTQTIDIHGSPASTALRQEIRQRLTAGESSEAIESSLVQRYGSKILAVPVGSQLGSAGGFLIVAMGAAGVGAVVLLRRWQRRSKPTEGAATKPAELAPADAALDARIDAELASLDRD
jgi:cytochrome c-type biogenesis protein CcmH